MIPLDTAKIKAGLLARCRKLMRQFAREDEDMRAFETRHLPAFARWKHEALGPEIAACRDAHEELLAEEWRLQRAEAEAWRTGLSPRVALQRWERREEMMRRRREAEAAAGHADDRRDARGPESPGEDEIGFDADEPPFGDPEDETPPFEGFGPRIRGPDRPASPVADAVRDRYRRLCRLLHPDAAGALTGERRQLWDQAQEAYAGRDLARLEMLLARVEERAFAAGIWAPATAGEALGLLQHYQDAVRSLRQVLRQVRRHPAWMFELWDESRRRRLRDDLQLGLRHELTLMRRRIEQIRAYLRPPPPRRPRARARPALDDIPELPW